MREAITAYIREQRDAIVLDGAVRTGSRLASLADQSMAIEHGALSLSTEELAKRVESVRRRLVDSRKLVSENLALVDRRTGEFAGPQCCSECGDVD
jgi:hypothetical protein